MLKQSDQFISQNYQRWWIRWWHWKMRWQRLVISYSEQRDGQESREERKDSNKNLHNKSKVQRSESAHYNVHLFVRLSFSPNNKRQTRFFVVCTPAMFISRHLFLVKLSAMLVRKRRKGKISSWDKIKTDDKHYLHIAWVQRSIEICQKGEMVKAKVRGDKLQTGTGQLWEKVTRENKTVQTKGKKKRKMHSAKCYQRLSHRLVASNASYFVVANKS